MRFRIPAMADTWCPKCHAANEPRQVCGDKLPTIWEVADADYHQFECDNCAHAWARRKRSGTSAPLVRTRPAAGGHAQ